jgi:SAM-dependent methyltransferase
MGIATGALRFILGEGVRERWSGAALTLGRQDTGFTLDTFKRAAREMAYPLAQVRVLDQTSEKNVPHDMFFRLLGFDVLDVMDISGFEGANIIHDLNVPSLPTALANRFDLVFDGGTLEHVFDTAVAMKSLCQMVKVGGRILHISPMANCTDHGFYSFSPTLFADFYGTNAFEIQRLSICRFQDDPTTDDWEYIEYDPKRWGTIGALDDAAYFLVVSAKRLIHSTFDRKPQQTYYRERAWPGAAPGTS